MNLRTLTILLISIVYFVIQISAQCTTEQLTHNDWVYNNDELNSQAWAADCDGDLEEVEFLIDDGWTAGATATFYLRSGDNCTDLWTAVGIAITPGEIVNINLPGEGSGDSRTVVNGTKYMVALMGNDPNGLNKMRLSTNDPYAPGSFAITSSGGNPWCDEFFNNWDLWFRISIDEALVPLPVELSYFEVKQNNLGFEIQRSTDGQNWNTIDFVEGLGTTTITQEYLYTDETAFLGDNYYRLKQIDFDGQFSFSSIEHINLSLPQQKYINIYPNPSHGNFTINVHNINHRTALLKLFDSAGIVIWERRFANGEMSSNWRKEFHLNQQGIYFLSAQIGENIEVQKVVIADK